MLLCKTTIEMLSLHIESFKVQVGTTCLQIGGSLIQRTHCMTFKYNLIFILPHCHYPLVLNVCWKKQLPSTVWKIKNCLLANQKTSMLPTEITYIPSSVLPLVEETKSTYDLLSLTISDFIPWGLIKKSVEKQKEERCTLDSPLLML